MISAQNHLLADVPGHTLRSPIPDCVDLTCHGGPPRTLHGVRLPRSVYVFDTRSRTPSTLHLTRGPGERPRPVQGSLKALVALGLERTEGPRLSPGRGPVVRIAGGRLNWEAPWQLQVQGVRRGVLEAHAVRRMRRDLAALWCSHLEDSEDPTAPRPLALVVHNGGWDLFGYVP